MTRPPDTMAVFADLHWFPEPRRMGSLRRQVGRGGEVISFENDRDWLTTTSGAFSLDPDLALVQGPQYPGANRASFGIFLDSAPGAWELVAHRPAAKAGINVPPARGIRVPDSAYTTLSRTGREVSRIG